MTKVLFKQNLPFFDRDDFLTPFDKMFDNMVDIILMVKKEVRKWEKNIRHIGKISV